MTLYLTAKSFIVGVSSAVPPLHILFEGNGVMIMSDVQGSGRALF
jgi:hypothetical protein